MNLNFYSPVNKQIVIIREGIFQEKIRHNYAVNLSEICSFDANQYISKVCGAGHLRKMKKAGLHICSFKAFDQTASTL